MINSKKVLALIPARSGSKGLPGKNIKKLLGKPLINWSIDNAKKSKYIDDIVVSTDSKDIAEIARNAGAEVPFIRPKDLASDTAKRIDVIYHTLDFLESGNRIYDYLIFIEPTSPLRDVEDINEALEKLDANKSANSIVSIGLSDSSHPEFLSRLKSDFIVPYKNDSFDFKRRQDIENLYFFDGSFYISRINALREKGEFYHDETMGFILSKDKNFEIDDIVDFVIVESLIQAKRNRRIK